MHYKNKIYIYIYVTNISLLMPCVVDDDDDVVVFVQTKNQRIF